MSFLFICSGMFIPIGTLISQDTILVTIDSIIFDGNKRTKQFILERELTIKVGSKIPQEELMVVLEENTQRLLNTNLFSKAEFNIKSWSSDNMLVVKFTIREQWYLTGYFVFDLADRNFNVWWQEQNRSLSRVNYGVRAQHENLTGRGDELTFGLTLGYTRRFDVEYDLPNINKNRTLGLRAKFYFSDQREVNYTTVDNKFSFFRGEDFQLRTMLGEVGLVYRPKLDFYHKLDLEYHQNESSDTLAKIINPDFFLKGRLSQQATALQYTFVADRRKQRPYTKSGWYLKSSLRKEGLGLFKDRNAISLTTTYAKYFRLSEKWSLESIVKLHFFFNRDQQPYYNSRSFGSKPDYLTGYELYVVDGMDFAYLKNSLRFQVLNRTLDSKIIPLFQKMRLLPMPIQVYLSLNGDWGYVNDPYYFSNNSFSNRALWGGGIGLDLVAYYDKIFQIQYSFNVLGENGLFLHYKYKF